MARFSEETLANWTLPASSTEESKLANAERAVKDAIYVNKFSTSDVEAFGQGSYANDTNVKNNSDIDINVCYHGGFFYQIPPSKTKEDFGLVNPISYGFIEYKNDIEALLVTRFGRSAVTRNNKCITISESSTRVETDVVPTWRFRRYNEDGNYVVGVKFRADSGEWIESFPKQHIENGKAKNRSTFKRFKRLTRIFRKARYQMIASGEIVNKNISSFLLECLVWNCPDRVFNNYTTWTERLRQAVIYLYNATNGDDCNKWGEVSDLLYLFHSERKWTKADVNAHMLHMWQYFKFTN
ncbi:MAG: nucleotidyltransferase [Sphingobacteriales bacterium]|nr:MAG: nucleotidyltransferase [Sphingobacteriales bacterium]